LINPFNINIIKQKDESEEYEEDMPSILLEDDYEIIPSMKK
jgi:hypothetical protein